MYSWIIVCSNYTLILNLTPAFNGLVEDKVFGFGAAYTRGFMVYVFLWSK